MKSVHLMHAVCPMCIAADVEIEQLRQELAKYKPPEPKFRVGEVVIVTTFKPKEAPMKIRERHLGTQNEWWYVSDHSGAQYNESVLRSLTSEELPSA